MNGMNQGGYRVRRRQGACFYDYFDPTSLQSRRLKLQCILLEPGGSCQLKLLTPVSLNSVRVRARRACAACVIEQSLPPIIHPIYVRFMK